MCCMSACLLCRRCGGARSLAPASVLCWSSRTGLVGGRWVPCMCMCSTAALLQLLSFRLPACRLVSKFPPCLPASPPRLPALPQTRSLIVTSCWCCRLVSSWSTGRPATWHAAEACLQKWLQRPRPPAVAARPRLHGYSNTAGRGVAVASTGSQRSWHAGFCSRHLSVVCVCVAVQQLQVPVFAPTAVHQKKGKTHRQGLAG